MGTAVNFVVASVVETLYLETKLFQIIFSFERK